MEGAKKSIVVIPTYNERPNIEELVDKIRGLGSSPDVLIVDDGSPDGTGLVADGLAEKYESVSVLHRKERLGLSSAYVEGFSLAIRKGYDYIAGMDADFSHDPVVLPALFGKLAECDVAVGSRYVAGGGIDRTWPLHRRALSRLANFYARAISGLRVRDCTSGFVAYRRQSLEKIDLAKIKSRGYSFMIETKFICQRKGLSICEVPIIFTERKAGRTKLNFGLIREAAWLVWRLRLGI